MPFHSLYGSFESSGFSGLGDLGADQSGRGRKYVAEIVHGDDPKRSKGRGRKFVAEKLHDMPAMSGFGFGDALGFEQLLGDLGAAKKKKRIPRAHAAVLRKWKRANGIKLKTRATDIVVKKSKDGKTCSIELTFENPKGGKALVFKWSSSKSPFRPFARICKRVGAGQTARGKSKEAAEANDEAEAEATQAESEGGGEDEGGEEEEASEDMAGFGAVWRAPAGYYQVDRLDTEFSGAFGAVDKATKTALQGIASKKKLLMDKMKKLKPGTERAKLGLEFNKLRAKEIQIRLKVAKGDEREKLEATLKDLEAKIAKGESRESEKAVGFLGMFGDFGAAKKKKLRYTRDQAIAKFKRLRDEDAQLKVAYETANSKDAGKAFSRLARLRDHFYKAAGGAAKGKRFSQIATLGIGGASGRAKLAEHFLQLGDAAEAIFRYWKGKFGEKHRSGAAKLPSAVVSKIRALSVAGMSHKVKPAKGEDVTEVATNITATVKPTVTEQDLERASSMEVRTVEDTDAFTAANEGRRTEEMQSQMGPSAYRQQFGPSSMRQGRGAPAMRPGGRRGRMQIGEEIQSGVPAGVKEFEWAGAVGLGALGALLIAPVILK